ncbi:MAG TPA: hypothetical protein VL307_18645, partial [Chitinophagaceae bacterium]|nr:hypothetical protein [Chitinophagaceae bacterium]
MSTAINSRTDYKYTLEVKASPAEAFAIINNVPAWWNDTMTGCSTAVGDEFSVRFADIHHSTQRVTKL